MEILRLENDNSVAETARRRLAITIAEDGESSSGTGES